MGVDLGGYSVQDAKAALTEQFNKYAQTDVVLRYGGKEWRTTPGALGVRFDADATVRQALQIGRSGGLPDQIGGQLASLRDGRTVSPVLTTDPERQAAVVNNLAREIDRPMINASLVTHPDGTIEMTASQIGRKLDTQDTLRRVKNALGVLPPVTTIDLPVTETPPRVVEAQLAAAKETAERILSSSLTLTAGSESLTFDRKQLTSMLSFRQEGDKTVAELDEKPLTEAVTQMAKKINRKPIDAKFRFTGGKVELVSESRDGVTVEVGPSVQLIRERSLTDQRTVALVTSVQPPKYASSDLANIVIKDKITEAATVYGDTGAERQYNLRLATSRLNGNVVPPGETFSFNAALGPTTLADGYKMAWGIISTPNGHETVPSEAGGICQVATTLFQATLWAGLKIDQRTEHIYWIPRYGKPPLGKTGLDATVDGSGSPDTLDFKFTNNTPNWLAIEARTDAMNLYFAIWGVKPDWTVEVGEPVITKVVKTDPAVRRELDNTLKPGQEVWVETAQDGFHVSVQRIVRQGGKVIDTYSVDSDYRPAYNVVRYGPPATPSPTPTPGAAGAPSGAPPAAGAAPQPQVTPQPQPTATPQPQATPTPKR